MTLTSDNIKIIYDWYCSAMRYEGYKVSAPKNTDFAKTYHYRAMSKFAKTMEDRGFSDDTIKTIIRSVVRYGKKHKLLGSKGTSILNMKSIVDICLKDIQSRETSVKEIIESVKRGCEYIASHGLTEVELAKPVSIGGMPRLKQMLDTGELPMLYLAVSRMAATALDKIDRSAYPSDNDLMKIRARLIFNEAIREELKHILGTDLNTAGLPRSIAC